MKKRILVTGGAGFIGVNLVAHLCAFEDYEIAVIDNETSGRRVELKGCDVKFIYGDIRDTGLLEASLSGQDVVIHLAADTRVMDSIASPHHNYDINVDGSFRLLEVCRKLGISRIVAASTGGAILGEVPAPVHEGMAARPLSPYGASKLAMEGYLSAYHGAYGMATCALRFSNIYGPRSFHKGSVVAHFFKQILSGKELIVYGDGSQARDFLYVEDLTEAIRQAVEGGVTGVYQLGNGRPTTIRELLLAIAEVTGNNSLPVQYREFRAGEIHTTWCDITKAKSAFGFNPNTSLIEGLAKTWNWFQESVRN